MKYKSLMRVIRNRGTRTIQSFGYFGFLLSATSLLLLNSETSTIPLTVSIKDGKVNQKCLMQQRECFKNCADRDPPEICNSDCNKKYPCKSIECQQRNLIPCLFLANFPQECYTDSECENGRKCCKSGRYGCIKKCMDISDDLFVARDF